MLARNDNHAAVLSFACWSREFGRDPNVLGQVLRLNGHGYTVVGVTPNGFTGTTVESSPDLWIPFANKLDFARSVAPNIDRFPIEIIARLRAGASSGQAQKEAAADWTRYRMELGFVDSISYHGLKKGTLEVQSNERGVSPLRAQSTHIKTSDADDPSIQSRILLEQFPNSVATT